MKITATGAFHQVKRLRLKAKRFACESFCLVNDSLNPVPESQRIANEYFDFVKEPFFLADETFRFSCEAFGFNSKTNFPADITFSLVCKTKRRLRKTFSFAQRSSGFTKGQNIYYQDKSYTEEKSHVC